MSAVIVSTAVQIGFRLLERAAAHHSGELDSDTEISRLIEVSRSSRPEQLSSKPRVLLNLPILNSLTVDSLSTASMSEHTALAVEVSRSSFSTSTEFRRGAK